MFDPSTQYDSSYPLQMLGPGGVSHLNSIKAIAGGERHNVTLDTNGEVWTLGWNAFGQLGNGIYCTSDAHSTDCMSTTPVKIPGFTSVKAIASKGYHSLALKIDVTVWAWGYNDHGRLGDGTTIDRHSPVQIGGLNGHGGVTDISGGGVVNMALMADHTLMGWGQNNTGAVGNGTFTDQFTPVAVSQSTGLTNVVQVASGWAHVVALASDGTIWTWGANHKGELGNGTTISSSIPIQVSGLSNVIGVSAGDGSTAVLKADGTVWAWGSNLKGDCASPSARRGKSFCRWSSHETASDDVAEMVLPQRVVECSCPSRRWAGLMYIKCHRAQVIHKNTKGHQVSLFSSCPSWRKRKFLLTQDTATHHVLHFSSDTLYYAHLISQVVAPVWRKYT